MNSWLSIKSMGALLPIVVTILVIVAILFFVMSKLEPRSGGETWPFYAKKPLSAPEQVLFFRISKALPEHIVLAQVGLSRILGVKRGHKFQTWQNRIDRKSADFVVCSKDSTILAVIELDDSTHERPERKHADATKEKALSSAGLRLIRWNVKSLPDEASIKAVFHA